MGLVFTPEALLLLCTPGKPVGNPTGLLGVSKEESTYLTPYPAPLSIKNIRLQ